MDLPQPRKTAYDFSTSVPTFQRADVVVVGGGPGGCAAAVAAAREGRSVILLERSGQLGGMATIGNVAIYMPIGVKTGFYKEMSDELNFTDLSNRDWDATHKFAPLFDPFRVRLYLNEKLAEVGVEVFFHMDFVDVAQSEDGTIEAVLVNTRQGLRAIEASVFIDATGDGNVAIKSGVGVTTGRPTDGLTQPMTMMFQMQDTGKPVTPVLPKGCPEYNTVEELPQGRHLWWENKATGTVLFNMTRVKGLATDIASVSDVEREALRQVFGVANYLQRTQFPNHILSHVATQTGVRQTHQIQGLYTLTEDDLCAPKDFEDTITQCDYEIDIHNPDGAGGCDERAVGLYNVPFRCLIAMETPNLIAAGRCLSATHVAMSSIRVMPSCFGLGQGAGVAAAIAVAKGLPVQEVPGAELSAKLEGQGVVFEDVHARNAKSHS